MGWGLQSQAKGGLYYASKVGNTSQAAGSSVAECEIGQVVKAPVEAQVLDTGHSWGQVRGGWACGTREGGR